MMWTRLIHVTGVPPAPVILVSLEEDLRSQESRKSIDDFHVKGWQGMLFHPKTFAKGFEVLVCADWQLPRDVLLRQAHRAT
jgi:hypothetical protein